MDPYHIEIYVDPIDWASPFLSQLYFYKFVLR